MKEQMKAFSAAVLLLGILSLLPIHSLADTNLDHSGKLQIKMDRIGEDNAQIQQQESQDYKETELEQIAPDLFKKQTQDAIKENQAKQETETKKIKQNLFASPHKPDTALKDMEKTLFTGNYTIQNTVASNENSNDNAAAGSISNKMVTILGGALLAICGGFYVLLRKWMG